MWVGDGWCCIDGHHRLEAYRKAQWKKSVPVTVFSADLQAALGEAARANAWDKLAMSKREKSDTAWRLTAAFDYPVSLIERVSGLSERTAWYMKRVKITLLARKVSTAEMADPTWLQAGQRAKGAEMPDYDDSWRQEQAQKLADAPRRHLNDRPKKNAEVTAQALEIAYPGLLDEMARCNAYRHNHDTFVFDEDEAVGKDRDEEIDQF